MFIPTPAGDSDYSTTELSIGNNVYKFSWEYNLYDNFWYLEIYNITVDVVEVAATKIIKGKKVVFRHSDIYLKVINGSTTYTKNTFNNSLMINPTNITVSAAWERVL